MGPGWAEQPRCAMRQHATFMQSYCMPLHRAAQQAWEERLATRLSDRQRQVEEALQRLAIKHSFKVEREGTTPDGMFVVDVLVSMPGAHGQVLLVAVELDGPYRPVHGQHAAHPLRWANTSAQLSALSPS